MAKRIELQIGEAKAVAVLNESGSPRSSRKLWDALPIEETLRHVRWSGSAGYVLCEALHDPSFQLEERVSFYPARTVNYRPEHGELAISYADAQARDFDGNSWATHLATIEGDAAAFLEAVAQVRHMGKQKLVIARKGS